MPQLFRRSYSGFTLIELLVVVAIIALLASILFPVFGRARETARRTSCISNLKQVGLAVEQYKQDYNRFLDNEQTLVGCPSAVLFPYTKSKQIWVCPSDTNVTVQAMTDTRIVSYQLNAQVNARLDAVITRPADIVIAHDANPGEGGWVEGNTFDAGLTTDFPHFRTVCDNGNTTAPDTYPNCGRNSYKAAWFMRHNGTFNALFYDGHAKSIVASPTTLTDKNFVP
jgi:prepilin-type N-terminal cleavage/methylation domain-containing protein/prepilin-type processing-associated H-X9-DG protein